MRGNSKYFSKRIYLNMHCLLPKEGLQLLCQFFVAINKLGIILHFCIVCSKLRIAVIASPTYAPQIKCCRVSFVGGLLSLVRDCHSAIMCQLGFRHAGNRIL